MLLGIEGEIGFVCRTAPTCTHSNASLARLKASTSEKRREILYSLLYGRLDVCFNRNRLFPTSFRFVGSFSTATPKEDLESVGLNDFQI